MVFEPTGAYHRAREHALAAASMPFAKVNPPGRPALIRDRTAVRNHAGQLRLALLRRQGRARLARIERDLGAGDAAIRGWARSGRVVP